MHPIQTNKEKYTRHSGSQSIECYIYKTKDSIKTYKVTRGVSPGSVLGPSCWNIMYDRLLRLQQPGAAKVVAFVDDIAVIIAANHKDKVMKVAGEMMCIIHKWTWHPVKDCLAAVTQGFRA